MEFLAWRAAPCAVHSKNRTSTHHSRYFASGSRRARVGIADPPTNAACTRPSMRRTVGLMK